jgi:hypothetical protein|tara:strand:- start:3155 stop:3478 length:324 start_codon:yes stop_codon:yes gene_type:complete
MKYETDRCLKGLKSIFEVDNIVLHEKDNAYRGSWKKRGGVGAFMMLCRKWDRIEAWVEGDGFDIFKAIGEDKRDESILDDIRDLRRYLALVEAEMKYRENAALDEKI